jgi:hypothetical protein
MNYVVNLECDMIVNNDVIFDTPKKQTECSQYRTPEQKYQEISQLKDTFRFLSPATKSLLNHYTTVSKRQTNHPNLNTMPVN